MSARLVERVFLGTTGRAPKRPLPRYARALVGLGEALYRAGREGGTNLVVLVVPTRSFAAWFVTLGSVSASLASSESDEGSDAIPCGATVQVVLKDKIYKGVYGGRETKTVDGGSKLYHVIQLRGDKRMSFPDGLAQIVEMAPRARRPKMSSFKPTELPSGLTFAGACLGLDDPVRFQAKTEPVVNVVGTRSKLTDELSAASLFTKASGKWLHGSFKDLLRVRDTHASGGYRVSLLASLSEEDLDAEAPVVVLDGALAVVRKGLDFPGSAVLLLLDPSEPSFSVAVNELEQQAMKLRQAPAVRALTHPGFGTIERAWLTDA